MAERILIDGVSHMNIKRGLWRLAIVLSTAWTGEWFILFFTDRSPNEAELWIGLGGGVVIWICYWVSVGFFKDKSDESDS